MFTFFFGILDFYSSSVFAGTIVYIFLLYILPYIGNQQNESRKMSFMLTKLTSKNDVDSAIKDTEDLVLVLRFGRDEDKTCLQLDHIVRYTDISHNLEIDKLIR